WAGITALINQARGIFGKPVIGVHLNQSLYDLFSSNPINSPDFHDIQVGTQITPVTINDINGIVLAGSSINPAEIGYDQATGIGTRVVAQLLQDVGRADPAFSDSAGGSWSANFFTTTTNVNQNPPNPQILGGLVDVFGGSRVTLTLFPEDQNFEP